MQRYMRGMTNGGAVMARNGDPLTDDALRAAVPSIFATEAHESRSDRFAPVPTINVLNGLRNEGFEPFFAQQQATRDATRRDFCKHMLRLRHRGLTNADGEAFEIILLNANDGSAAYQMIPGFFRFVCANGLFVGDSFDDVKVRHSGNAVGEVIEGAYRVLDDAPQVVDQVSRFRSVSLSDREQAALAEAAHVMRFPAHHATGSERREAPITADRLLTARRSADNGADLWSTFNRVQENTLRGGQRGITRNANGQRRRASVREVQGIDQTRGLNRALWTLAERMAELKEIA